MIRMTVVALGCLAWFDGPAGDAWARAVVRAEEGRRRPRRRRAGEARPLVRGARAGGPEAPAPGRRGALRPVECDGSRADGAGGVRRQVEEARGRRRRREGRRQTRRPVGRIRRPARADARQIRRPVQAGAMVRGEGPEGRGPRPPRDGRATRPEPRRGLEETGVQEGRQPPPGSQRPRPIGRRPSGRAQRRGR